VAQVTLEDACAAAPDDSGGVDPWGPFRVERPSERVALLKQLRDNAAPVLISAPSGGAMTTTLRTVDGHRGQLCFSASSEPLQLPAIVASNEGVAIAYLDSIKLQFDLHGLVLVRGERVSALQCLLPNELYRFQRRGAYRVSTLERRAPTAHLRHPAIPEMALALQVLDVSIGGCALFVPADVPPLEPGLVLQGVRIALDANTRFDVALNLNHVTSIPGNDTGVRIGCQWQQLVGAHQRALARYIEQAQKWRRLLAQG
jgi:c-di-GMP-binding flagellar brake protein YcgR